MHPKIDCIIIIRIEKVQCHCNNGAAGNGGNDKPILILVLMLWIGIQVGLTKAVPKGWPKPFLRTITTKVSVIFFYVEKKRDGSARHHSSQVFACVN